MGDASETRIETEAESKTAASTTENPTPESAAKKKRVADRQITQDDPDDEDEEDKSRLLNEPFEKASPEVMAKRKILKAKSPTAQTGSSTSNPFALTTLKSDTDSSNSNGTKKVFGSGSSFSGFSGFGSGTSKGFGTSSSNGSGFGIASSGGFGTSSSISSGFGSAAKSTGFGAISANNSAEEETKTTAFFGGSTSGSGFSFGFTKTTPASSSNTDAANTEPTITLPESVELTTGEESERKLCEIRCKAFKWVEEEKVEKPTESTTIEGPSVKQSSTFENITQESSSEQKEVQKEETSAAENGKPRHRWQELGIGPLKILRSTEFPDKFRMVQRRESSPNGPAHKVILNVPLWKESTCKKTSEKHLSVTTVGSSGKGETYALKFKEAAQAAEFLEQIEEICSEAKSCFSSD